MVEGVEDNGCGLEWRSKDCDAEVAMIEVAHSNSNVRSQETFMKLERCIIVARALMDRVLQ